MPDAKHLLVVGAGGLLGNAVVRYWRRHGWPVVTASHAIGNDYTIELNTRRALLLGRERPTAALICSAVSALDLCREDWPGTYRFNVTNTIALIDNLAAQGVRPVFCSSDQVFNGETGGNRETAPPDPRTAYGRQKLAVEKHILRNCDTGLVIRMGKLYGDPGLDTSPLSQTVDTLASGKQVRAASDLWLTLTHVDDIARALGLLLDGDETGVVHLTAPNAMVRLDFASTIAGRMGRSDLVSPIRIADLDLAEPRPLNTTLDGSRFATNHDFLYRDWTAAIDAFAASAGGPKVAASATPETRCRQRFDGAEILPDYPHED